MTHAFRRPVLYLALALGLFTACPQPGRRSAEPAAGAARRPNILLLVADDLGYSDLGFLGSAIRTPNLDALAASGMVLTNFHVAPTCSTTRAMLLTGVDTHPAGMGTASGHADDNQLGQTGYETFLSHRVVTVARLLQDAGYATSMVGKWHLGEDEELGPHRRGFERSFVLSPGGASHFADAQRLGTDETPAPYREDGHLVELPADFYSTDFYTDKLIEYLDEAHDGDRPFFAYAAYTAPHWPLQAPDAYIDRYRGAYDEGWDTLRARRMAGLVRAGVVDPDRAVPPRLPFVPAWGSLPAEQRAIEARKMELYAAMVENLDTNIGRVLEHLRKTGEYDDTVILFFSDNGAEGNPIDEADWTWKGHDNRLENMGRVGSYISYGPGWAQAATVPFRLFKSFPTDGGTRVPAIVVMPGAAASRGLNDAFATVKDVVPTALELAGVEHPGPRYRSRPVAELEGASLLPFLRGEVPTVHPADYAMGWELFGRRALRRGDWKLVWLWEPYGDERWALYDLATDPGEAHDLSEQHPEKLQELVALWEAYAERNGVILPTRDMSYALETF
jgi:arylsulfatase